MIILPYDCIHEMGARVASAKKPFREQKLDKLTSVHELETLHSGNTEKETRLLSWNENGLQQQTSRNQAKLTHLRASRKDSHCNWKSVNQEEAACQYLNSDDHFSTQWKFWKLENWPTPLQPGCICVKFNFRFFRYIRSTPKYLHPITGHNNKLFAAT